MDALMKLRALFWLITLTVFLNGCAVFFAQLNPCETEYDVVLERTGSYRAAFDAYMDCLEREENE